MRQQIALTFLTVISVTAFAQSTPPAHAGDSRKDTQLNELRAAPVPRQGRDLDTLQLASAQRERAISIEEKTNGLWQSWTMSICEGCGNTPSYRKTIDENFKNQKGLYLSRSNGRALRNQALVSRADPSEQHGRSLYADLSSQNISQIRRMPGR